MSRGSLKNLHKQLSFSETTSTSYQTNNNSTSGICNKTDTTDTTSSGTVLTNLNSLCSDSEDDPERPSLVGGNIAKLSHTTEHLNKWNFTDDDVSGTYELFATETN